MRKSPAHLATLHKHKDRERRDARRCYDRLQDDSQCAMVIQLARAGLLR